MTDHTAFRVGTARAWTRIPTLPVYAGQVTGALAVAHALWSAVRRGTDELGQTGAGRFVVDGLVDRIGSTLTGRARVLFWHIHGYQGTKF